MTPERHKDHPMRSGYTTGACATAAAKAATMALLYQKIVRQIEIDLPGSGNKASFKIEKCAFSDTQASCSVIKDAGDDPDVTHQAEICAAVSWKTGPGIEIEGGKGVGLVTKPGLEIPVGRHAINPVPRQMITRSVTEAAGSRLDSHGIRVIISVPRGEELAKRTLNRQLGIVGGISILGTTGIVIPYSINAYKACIAQSLDIAVACGCRQAVLTTGRRSGNFARKELAALTEECFIQSGDFIGYSLQECAKRPLDKVTVWGMVGKISKLAVGHFYTNVSDSRVDIGFLVEVAASCGVSQEMVKVLQETVTANHLRKTLPAEYTECFSNRLCLLAARKCREMAGGKLEVECIMSDYGGEILGRANDNE